MYNGGVGAVGSAKKDDPAAGADVREEVLEERVEFGHAAIIQEGRRVVIRNPSAPMESLLWLLVRIGTQPSEKDRLTAGLHLIDARPLVKGNVRSLMTLLLPSRSGGRSAPSGGLPAGASGTNRTPKLGW